MKTLTIFIFCVTFIWVGISLLLLQIIGKDQRLSFIAAATIVLGCALTCYIGGFLFVFYGYLPD